MRKSKSEADQGAVGRGEHSGRVRSVPAAREDGGRSWGPCCLLSGFHSETWGDGGAASEDGDRV